MTEPTQDQLDALQELADQAQELGLYDARPVPPSEQEGKP